MSGLDLGARLHVELVEFTSKSTQPFVIAEKRTDSYHFFLTKKRADWIWGARLHVELLEFTSRSTQPFCYRREAGSELPLPY